MARKLTFDELLAKREQREADKLKVGLLELPGTGKGLEARMPGQKTVLDLLPAMYRDLFPVGRLDKDTEGLLLLTNDGELAQRLTHPSCEVDKVYLARVTGNPSNDALDRLRRGVYMEGDERRTYPAQVRVVRDESLFSDILVTIHEGRNRQVRRMFDSVGHKVLLLRRVRFGPLELGDLRRGEWRELSAEEIARLKAL